MSGWLRFVRGNDGLTNRQRRTYLREFNRTVGCRVADLIPWCPTCGRRIWCPTWLAVVYPGGVRTHVRCWLRRLS